MKYIKCLLLCNILPESQQLKTVPICELSILQSESRCALNCLPFIWKPEFSSCSGRTRIYLFCWFLAKVLLSASSSLPPGPLHIKTQQQKDSPFIKTIHPHISPLILRKSSFLPLLLISHQCERDALIICLSHLSQQGLGIKPATQRYALDQISNPQLFSVQADDLTIQIHRPGAKVFCCCCQQVPGSF